MATIPKSIIERYKKSVPKFKKVLEIARKRDINEADTVAIIQDMLAEVFGFDKYIEITSEYCIRGTYCDLAIKMDDKIQYLLEVKAIGLVLKDNHLRQVIDYGANQGVNWVILTNGIIWNIYKIKFERPINYELVVSFNFLDLNLKKTEDLEMLFLLSKRGISKAVREDFYERSKSVNRFVIGAILVSDSIKNSIRRDIRKISPGVKVELSDIDKILRNEVLKREVFDGDDATKAINKIKKLQSGTIKRPRKKKTEKTQNDGIKESSFSEKLLKNDTDENIS